MRATKRTFVSFRPRECDSFEAYLHEQSLKGWHFKEWRFGLVFEKGEPLDTVYAVEISPKASDQDMRPSEDTKDYASYCEAAGWKLLDSHGKVCVFKKQRKDACPIVEERERFENIVKEEKDDWIRTYMTALSLSVLYIIQFFILNFERWAFDNLMMSLVITIITMGIFGVLEGICLRFWIQKQKRRLEQGKPACYQGWGISVSRTKTLLVVVLVFFIFNIMMKNQISQLVPLFLLVVGLSVIAFIVSWWKPLGETKQIFEMGGIFLLFFVLLIGIISGVFSKTKNPEVEMQQSVFGSSEIGTIAVTENEIEFEVIDYKIYRSPYEWVLNRIWEKWNQDAEERSGPHISEEEHMEVIKVWGAESGFTNGAEGNYIYCMKYKNCLIWIYVDSNLENPVDGIPVLKECLQIP